MPAGGSTFASKSYMFSVLAKWRQVLSWVLQRLQFIILYCLLRLAEFHISCVSFSCLGYGGLTLSVEGPSKADIDCKDKPDGTTGVVYKPTQPGTYVISIKFADEHVPGKKSSLSLL